MTATATRALSGHSEDRAGADRGPLVVVLVHSILSFCGHRELASSRRDADVYAEPIFSDFRRLGDELVVVVGDVVLGDLVGRGVPHAARGP